MQKLLSKYKAVLLVGLKAKTYPYHSKPPHLYGLPKIHKPDVPLRPTVKFHWLLALCLGWVSSQDSSPSGRYTPSFVKNSDHSIELLKSVNLQRPDTLVIYDVVSLFTNVPFDDAFRVIRGRPHTDHTLAERSPLQVETIMELLKICLRSTYIFSGG